jgi:hypothetical protein
MNIHSIVIVINHYKIDTLNKCKYFLNSYFYLFNNTTRKLLDSVGQFYNKILKFFIFILISYYFFSIKKQEIYHKLI